MKNVLHFSVNVFSKKVLIGDTILRLLQETGPPCNFTWSYEPREGSAAGRANAVP